jgi:hypothetical protein
MSAVQIPRAVRADHAHLGRAVIQKPSAGVSGISKEIADRLKRFAEPSPTFLGSRNVSPPKSLEEQLYDGLAAFKVTTATIAMHLEREWRSRLFLQLDSLLALDDWDVEDPPPSTGSFSTFLRMLILLRPARRPGLGATNDGILIATWTSDDDRLTIDCLDKDIARWHLAVTIEGERERAAGITPLLRLNEVLLPYGPQRWFEHAHYVSSP